MCSWLSQSFAPSPRSSTQLLTSSWRDIGSVEHGRPATPIVFLVNCFIITIIVPILITNVIFTLMKERHGFWGAWWTTHCLLCGASRLRLNPGKNLTIPFTLKHCQRHNGLEGWVQLTKATCLGHTYHKLKHKSWWNILEITRKHQLQNLD